MPCDDASNEPRNEFTMPKSTFPAQFDQPLPAHADHPVLATEGLVALSSTDSLRLLARNEVGRIVYTDGGLPAVTPVNYAFDGAHVLIRTSEVSQLVRKAPNAIVAFEVDDLDRQARRGWSVVVTGPCEIVTDPDKLAHVASLNLNPWAEGERNVVLQIAATIVTGYRIARDDSARDDSARDDEAEKVV